MTDNDAFREAVEKAIYDAEEQSEWPLTPAGYADVVCALPAVMRLRANAAEWEDAYRKLLTISVERSRDA